MAKIPQHQRSRALKPRLKNRHENNEPPSSTKGTSKLEKQKYKPSFPTNKKNHTLPVRLITSGTAYAGLRSRSNAVKIAFRIFRFSQLFAGLFTEARGVGEKLTAARRIKGVVSPQAIPTRRKPSVERKIEGEEASIGKSMCGFTTAW